MSSRMSSGPPSAPSVASSTPYYASTFRKNKTLNSSSSPLRQHLNPFTASATELTAEQGAFDHVNMNYSQPEFEGAQIPSNGNDIVALAAESAGDQHTMRSHASSLSDIGMGAMHYTESGPTHHFDHEGANVPHQALGVYDNAFSLLLDRVKQNANACKEVMNFIKRKAAIEEEYAKAMSRLAQSMSDTMEKNDGKLGSFGDAWKRICYIHERVGEVKLKFSEDLAEVANEVGTLHKNTVRSRKELKDGGGKHWKIVLEAEHSLEKTKSKYESASTEWESAIIQCQTGGTQMGPAGWTMKKSASNPFNMFVKSAPNPSKLQKNEDDLRVRVAQANDGFKRQLEHVQEKRNTYFVKHLPMLIKVVKEANDEADQGLQKSLVKYAQMYEQALMDEGITIAPLPKEDEETKMSLIRVIEGVDHEGDLHAFMKNYVPKPAQLQKAEQRFGAYFPTSLESSNKPVFGQEIDELTARDGGQVPIIVEKCIQIIERHGMRTVGLYRQSGSMSEIQSLRALVDRDFSKIDLEKYAADITVVCGLFKLWFRTLPTPLFTQERYHEFVEAAKIEDDRARLMHIHELVNGLSDTHFSTLQCLVAHLHRVRTREVDTKMNVQSLAIVWGPTLFGGHGATNPVELALQCRVVETILASYLDIFPDD
ncbi:hypothetical protein SeLEV6574_g00405 [Synchytrium endobioticum]|nr:hypothetical protein SeLEV6574_g00405 [Synchytrium endobioticum]